MGALTKLSDIRVALAKASSLKAILDIRDKAEAVRMYAKAAGYGRDIQNDAAEIKIEAEAKAGALLATMDKNPGARGGKTRSHDASTLSDLGIKYNQSARWQHIAKVKPNVRAKHFAAIRKEDGEVTSSGVLKLERKLRREAVEDHETPDLPKDKYRTIVIDPPWPVQKIDREVRHNQSEMDYPTMNVEAISDLDIQNLAAPAAHLYLWTTQRFLPSAFALVAAWDFKYLVTMVWHKPGGFQPVGLPQYNCEFVVLARRDGLAFTSTKAFPCCFEAPRREHSRKPDKFYDTVRRVSPGPRLDMFSREKRNGFVSWGSETGRFSK